MNSLTWRLLVIVSLNSLLACNTIQGLGRDIEKGGQAIERAAR
ncbi:MAG: entericidin A/B family lipoprotein [Candidatus Accumulibacter phosphatis]|uniref:Entericidin A/B family lipoprotein n=2 Tax=Candidatus Accumulibacter TaxID=327159 RepID=A0A080MHX3_9PROT|nr:MULTISPECIES: entericidin A/B family lipoprotein [Candidatus Accumulibacter]KFB76839.1 MAG: entericidin B membrane lipoprotein [Candidatus Accumulibacter cognatus]MBL8399490.1 entericidin A/B family lipoprotein [Accumulibacter sp.]MBN8519463.1 entericidin A/B family lipoprotein [Accumulibacter sp.]MBO3712947.1 entericidin A/B family lipoprotein [Accumulibacter sp.]MCC2867336.1 entericidin A/B family lipoprotein [Candidatus Accumulibacter phosphatis]